MENRNSAGQVCVCVCVCVWGGGTGVEKGAKLHIKGTGIFQYLELTGFPDLL